MLTVDFDRLGLRPTKSLGQNFVIDPNTVRRLVRVAGVGVDGEVERVQVRAVLAGGDHRAPLDDAVVGQLGVPGDDGVDRRARTRDDLTEGALGRDAGAVGRRGTLVGQQDDDVGLVVGGVPVRQLRRHRVRRGDRRATPDPPGGGSRSDRHPPPKRVVRAARVREAAASVRLARSLPGDRWPTAGIRIPPRTA